MNTRSNEHRLGWFKISFFGAIIIKIYNLTLKGAHLHLEFVLISRIRYYLVARFTQSVHISVSIGKMISID